LRVRIQLADSINVKRSPEARERILNGTMHRASCPKCKRAMTVEKPFYYTDFTRNALFKVFPRGERHTWKKASKDLDVASSFIPSGIVSSEGRTLRVIFGMDELREKLVAQDAALDDRALELLKVFVVYEHPFLLRRPRLRLVLDQVTETYLQFAAGFEHDPRRFRAAMPRQLADEIASDPKKLESWVGKAHKENIFDEPDHWVNMWRWSPQPTALSRLQGFVAEVKANHPIDTIPDPRRHYHRAIRGTARLSAPGWRPSRPKRIGTSISGRGIVPTTTRSSSIIGTRPSLL
jgi:hypothetical protein